jgi:PST family polysaccharide transporter
MSGTTQVPGRRVARGVAWSAVGLAGARGIGLVATAILARLLAPDDFGVLAFALVFMSYLETVGDMGAGAALIYLPGRREEVAQATFLISLTTGLLWFAVAFFSAPAVAAFFHRPEAVPVLRLLAAGVLIKALGNTHDALSRRALRFRARLAPELGLTMVKAAVALPLAAAGIGVWSLVAGQLAGLGAWTLLMWVIVPWRPGRTFPLGALRSLLGYGRGIVGVNVIASIVHHADRVVVGRLLGVTALGIYHIAFKITEALIQIPVWAVSRVIFPAFSRLRDSGELGAGYLLSLRYLGLATLPTATLLALTADLVVTLFLGPRWAPAAAVLRALAVASGIRSLGTSAGDVLKADGRPGLLAGLGALRAVVLVPALIFAGRWGIVAVAWTLAAVSIPFAVVNTAVACRRLAVSPRRVALALAPAFSASAVLATVLVLGRSALPDLAPLPLLGMTVPPALAAAAVSLRLMFPGVVQKAAIALRREIPATRSTPARASAPALQGEV